MKTTLRAATFALLSASALLAGCAADETADDTAQDVVESDDGKADVVRPLGTFTSDSAPAGHFVRLTLNANKTYEAQHQIYCITAPCIPPTETGTYKYSSAGSTKYIRLIKDDGSDGGKYAYTFSGDTLKYRKTNTTTWYTLKRDNTTVPAYCGGVGETRPRGGCPTGYACNCPNGAMCFVAGTCHKTCVQNAFCIQGWHFDDVACKCVPDSGPVCGTKTCAAGDVCCNPLMSICTKPGQFCIQ